MKFYYFGDKSCNFTLKGMERLEFSFCHCEESGARDAAIHRVPGERTGLAVRLLKVSGSPRPQGARDDKRELRDGAGRFVGSSGSPRATTSR